jgi:hypothetical protein
MLNGVRLVEGSSAGGSSIANGMVVRTPTVVNGATYTVLATDNLLHVTRTSAGTCVITIPSAFIAINGWELAVVDAGDNATTNNITIGTEAAELIDGGNTFVISHDSDAVTFYSNGSNVYVR